MNVRPNKETLKFMEKIIKLDKLIDKWIAAILQAKYERITELLDVLELLAPNISKLLTELQNYDLSIIFILDGNMLLKSYQDKVKEISTDFDRIARLEDRIEARKSVSLISNNNKVTKKISANDKFNKEIDKKLEEISRFKDQARELLSMLSDHTRQNDELMKQKEEKEKESKILLAQSEEKLANIDKKVSLLEQLEDAALRGDGSEKQYILEKLKKDGLLDSKELEFLDSFPKIDFMNRNKKNLLH